MSHALIPRYKEIGTFRCGAFFLPWLLVDRGVGLVIGLGPSIKPGTYRYRYDKHGRDPLREERYHVTSRQARLMAELTHSVLEIEQGKREEFTAMPSEERQRIESASIGLYAFPVRSDWIEKCTEFAAWAPRSGGFWIR